MTKAQSDEIKAMLAEVLKDKEMETVEEKNVQKKTIKKTKSKKEFSKKIYEFGKILVIIITLYTMAIVWKTGDLSPLTYLITASFGVFGTATGFYYWKAKAENIAKFAKDDILISENLKGNENI